MKAVAADLDLSPGNLSVALSDDPHRKFSVDDLENYIKATGDKTPIDEILAIMSDPDIEFTTKPMTISPMVNFMAKTGALRAKPERWQDLFFAEATGA